MNEFPAAVLSDTNGYVAFGVECSCKICQLLRWGLIHPRGRTDKSSVGTQITCRKYDPGLA